MRQEKRKELTRKKILEAAKQVFLQKGYATTRIADLVKKSRLARGTFYLYFQDVEQVLNALLQEVFIDIQRSVTELQVEALDHENFKIGLSELAKSLLAVFQKHSAVVGLLLTTMNSEPSIRVQTAWFQELTQATIRVMLERGIQSGRLKNHDPELMAFLVMGGLREVVTHWLIDGRYSKDIAVKVDEMIAIYMNGVERETQK